MSYPKLDFLTFQEVTSKNAVLLEGLKAAFPYQTICEFAGVGNVAIVSKWPNLAGQIRCLATDGLVAMQVRTPEGPLWLVSVHLHWPYPYGQAGQASHLTDYLSKLEGPTLLAGDFNMVPWSHTLRAFEQASETQIARPVRHSLNLPYIKMPIPIDHVLTPAGGTALTQRRDKLGSDHYGIVAEFTLAPLD